MTVGIRVDDLVKSLVKFHSDNLIAIYLCLSDVKAAKMSKRQAQYIK